MNPGYGFMNNNHEPIGSSYDIIEYLGCNYHITRYILTMSGAGYRQRIELASLVVQDKKTDIKVLYATPTAG